MTILVLNPSRVRNIFICCSVVFWASSRITNASLSVRPHVGERRHFDGAVVHVSFELVRSEHVGQRVVQRSQVRVDLFVERARQEAEVLPCFDGGTGQYDAPDLPVLKARTALATAR